MAAKVIDIVSFIETKLNAITVANGYHTTIKKVAVYRATPFGETEMPGINLHYAHEADAVLEDLKAGPVNIWTRSLPVKIEYAVQAGAGSDTTALNLAMDIIKAIGVDMTCGDKAIRIHDVKYSLTLEQEKKIVSGGTVEFTVEYRTNRFSET